MFVYKVCPAPLWHEAENKGVFAGAAIDFADGYIHFSTADQLTETLGKHFAGQQDLLLIEVDGDRLGASLKWEPSRGGALFPHLYAPLDLIAVTTVAPLLLDADGRHILPPLPI
ncbi:MAG: DUF952 domain-containing protein [Pseudolabrys sp.]|jgi:uncharacterized protein (DUF952 family)